MLQFCTASIISGVDCQDLVNRLNTGENTAKEVGENWESCQAAFLKDVSVEGLRVFFDALRKVTLNNRSRQPIFQAIANTVDLASKINIKQLESLTRDFRVTVPSEFFAKVQDIAWFNKEHESPKLPDNILEYYDGRMYHSSWITSEQFKLIGSKLEKEILCINLWLESSERDRLFGSINLKCLRGLLRSHAGEKIPWSSIPLEVFEKWTEAHVEADFVWVSGYGKTNLPTSVWKKVLESPSYLKIETKSLNFCSKDAIKNVLSKINHARFAEIASNRPDLATEVLELEPVKISTEIFASCGKEEMKVFLEKLGTIDFADNPSMITNISRDVTDDERHFCFSMSFETYESMPWLSHYAGDRCISLIKVTEGEDPEEFRNKLRKMRTGLVDKV